MLVNSGFFVKTDSFSVSYQNFIVTIWLLSFVISLFVQKTKISLKVVIFGLMYLASVLFGVLHALSVFDGNIFVYGINTSWEDVVNYCNISKKLFYIGRKNIQYFFRVFRFILIGWAVSTYWKDRDIRLSARKTLIGVFSLQIVIGFIDFMAKYFFGYPLLAVFNELFWGPSEFQVNSLIVRSNLPLLQGFMREPYYFALSLLPGVFLIAPEINLGVKRLLMLVVSCVLLVLTGSFAGFGIALVALGLIFIAVVKEKTMVHKILFLVGLLLFFAFISICFQEIINYYLSRCLSVLGILGKVGSENIRLFSIVECLKVFAISPFWGIGIGSVKAHGLIPSILANIGIMGCLSWLFYLKSVFRLDRSRYLYGVILFGLLFIVYSIEELYGFNVVVILIAISAFSRPGEYFAQRPCSIIWE